MSISNSAVTTSEDLGPCFSPEKSSKLSAAEREEIGWESYNEWDFENETLE
jgi:hypothetical protein